MSGFHGLCDAGAALPKSGAELSGALFPQPAIVAKKIIPTTNLKYLDDIFLHRVTYVTLVLEVIGKNVDAMKWM